MNIQNWLRTKWKMDNHKKYQKYFDEWFSNLTEYQIIGFEKQMYNDINNILRK